MKSTIEIDSDEPDKLVKVLEGSLTSDDNVSYILEEDGSKLVVEADTRGLGPLRGCTDTVFRLTSLSKKILEV